MWQKIKVLTGRIVMAFLVMLFAFAFAQTLPIDFALLVALDMAIYVDALVGVFIVASVARLRPMLAYLRLTLQVAARRFGKRARRTTSRMLKGFKKPANDDDPAWAMAA